MSLKNIEFKPEGFAQILSGLSGQVQAEAERIAARATAMLDGHGGFTVTMSNEPRFQDATYNVTRPVAYVSADDEASKEEAEHKILSRAVNG